MSSRCSKRDGVTPNVQSARGAGRSSPWLLPRLRPAASDPTVPVFDPSKAVAGFDPSNPVIEQFSAANDDNTLDKFVRDFEMQDARPRRRKPALVSETPSYGAEAPHAR